jgi:glycosyltransferase involved in cell wall biosynthesis
LLVFTDSYPYEVARENTFLEPELRFLREAFDRVIVLPSRSGGNRSVVPPGILVDDELASHLSARSGRPRQLLRAVFSGLTWRDIARNPSVLSSLSAVKRVVAATARAEFTNAWIGGYLVRHSLTARRCVAYTFWCNPTTTGLALAKEKLPGLVVVSRAHGADLYPDRYNPPFIPSRDVTLANLNRLFPDSEAGCRFVAEHYTWFADRVEVARMGVSDPGFLARPSEKGHLSIVSNSRIVPIKRVDLIRQAIEAAARTRPDITFVWHHFGDGESRSRIESDARGSPPANLRASFLGHVSLEAIMDFYRTQPVDVFINASISEGIPVAVMEAISCGIPVIATDVGGNPEIVSEESGILVGANPSKAELARALLAFVDDPTFSMDTRVGGRRVWAINYDAATTYRSFAQRLSALRSLD